MRVMRSLSRAILLALFLVKFLELDSGLSLFSVGLFCGVAFMED